MTEVQDKNRPNDSVGVEEKEYTLNDIFNLINKRFDEREEMMNKHFDNINKRFDESDKILDEWLREVKTDRLKENTVESKQVSDNNVVNDSEGIINQVSDNDNSNKELINR